MDEWILGNGLIKRQLPLAITLISEKLVSTFTRPAFNVVVLMPPLYITIAQLTEAVEALRVSITEVWRCSNASTRKNAEEVTA